MKTEPSYRMKFSTRGRIGIVVLCVIAVILLMGWGMWVNRHWLMVRTDAIKNFAQTSAWLGAALFFVYKVFVGYFYAEMSTSIVTTRSAIPGGLNDGLAVSVRLKKGSRGSIRLNDAQVRISYAGMQIKKELIGFCRQSYKTTGEGKNERQTVDWDNMSRTALLLRLPPDEETEFACFVEVPTMAICEIEVVILGRDDFWQDTGQWRASCVSLPGEAKSRPAKA